MDDRAKEHLIDELINKYEKKPCVCAYCGVPISFEEYVKQFERDKRFCSKSCYMKFKNNMLKNNGDVFSSCTERVIHNFMSKCYPHLNIRHNVTDIIEPYELDFVIDDYNLVIEYNGTLHFKNKYAKKKERKTKLNDNKKRKMLIKKGYCLCRLWSCIGLYTRPELMKEALDELKIHIDACLKDPHRRGDVIDVIVNTDHDIFVHINGSEISK